MKAIEPTEAVDSEILRNLLVRIRDSPGFANSPRLCRMLEYLVENSLSGDGRALQEYAVGLDVFDRGPDFDPHGDAIVRVTARRLRGRLKEYYDGAGRNDPLQVYIPKGHYRIEFRRTGHASRSSPRRSNLFLRLLPLSVLLVFLPLVLIGSFSERPVPNNFDAREGAAGNAEEPIRLARFLFGRHGPGDLQQAMALSETVAMQDPSYVDAWVGVAACLLAIATEEQPEILEEALARSEKVLELALELDPRHAEAHARMAIVAWGHGERERATRHTEQAVLYGLEDAMVLAVLANWQHGVGDLEAAIQFQRKSLELEPISTIGRLSLGRMLFNAGRFEEALAEYRQALILSGDSFGNARAMVATTLVQLGRSGEAEIVLVEARDSVYTDAARALILHAQGKMDDFRRALNTLAGRAGIEAAISVAEVYAATGHWDEALSQLRDVHALLAAGGPASSGRLRHLRQWYFLRPLYDSPEWQQQFASLD